MNSIGILAYGSLIDDPGCEIEEVIFRRLFDIWTPFKVEFARSSSTRGGAPTLVPIQEGRAGVKAVIFVLKEHVSIGKAKDMLWRRETNQVCSGKPYPGPNTVCIKELRQFQGIKTVLYTSIKPNKDKTTPHELAGLAIKSVCKTRRGLKRDGISYLINAKSKGIKTPLQEEYENEIKRQTKTESLEDALKKLQSSQCEAT